MFARMARLALLGTALLSPPLFAATGDIEIYVGANNGNTEVLPNVLFIIDTSGSMDTAVPYSMPYDHEVTYPDLGWGTNRIYVASAGKMPSTSDWFNASANNCDAAVNAIARYGYYASDIVAMYNTSLAVNKRTWVNPRSLSNTTRNYPVECGADYGIHGSSAGDPYPTNYTTTGFSTTATSKSQNFATWSNTGARSIYSSNYLNFLASIGSSSATLSRIQVVKNTLVSLLGSVNGINAAIMRFRSDAQGGVLVTPMLPLARARADYATNKTTLINAVKALDNPSTTPTAMTLYEAGLYFQGLTPQYGGAASSLTGVISGTKYVSPIKYQCQKNFIVYLSDGDPTYDSGADTLINNQPGFKTLTPGGCAFAPLNDPLRPTSDCAAAQALWLHKTDLSPNFPDSQSATIYTIGFQEGMDAFGKATMSAMATNGGGFYRPSTTMADIVSAFNEIITNIQAINTSFTAPAVSVNAFNRLSYLDQVYYAVFRASEQPKWDGNVKRYRLAKPVNETDLALLDVNNEKAIDPVTGFFKDSAKSYWSTVVDGQDVSLGGAAGQMTLNRNVYTCCFNSNFLYDPANKIHESNANLTDAILGTASTPERTAVLEWARGVDVNDSNDDGSTTDARTQMGDPLHTEPLLITYGKLPSGEVDMTLYTANNEGFLHAIDTATGEETFSFLPQELLGILRPLQQSDATNGHPFGLDGPITAWVYDKNHNGIIEAVNNDHVYLYLSERRGGNHIYALDVTDRAHPKMLWKITGGTGRFTELGETWSKPTLAKVKLGGTDRMVVFFGGGYDEGQSSYSTRTTDSIGRAIYMIDANTGDYIWSAGNTQSAAELKLSGMDYSIPSEPRVVDVNGDGYADRIYVGDMGGQIWRFDISVANSGVANFATGGILARFSDNSTIGNHRFYYPPSVSMSAKGEYLNVAIGSGWREHPLDRVVNDGFCVIRDRNVDGPARIGATPVYNVLSNFVDATSWIRAANVDTAALKASDGYCIHLRTDGTWQGEKVLAPAITVSGYVIFTTYTPIAQSQINYCSPAEGMAREYVMDVEDSTAMPNALDRYTTLSHGGIPPRPVVITVPDGTAILIGTNVQKGNVAAPRMEKTNWRRN